MTTTWRTVLSEEMAVVNDEGPVLAYAPDEAAFDVAFDDGFGSAGGPAILAWTPSRVYFPVTYDGSEWLESAPRNPCTEGQEHVGGQ